MNNHHIVLNNAGVHLSRGVKRLPRDSQWSRIQIGSVRGLPWNRNAGANDGNTVTKLISAPDAIPLHAPAEPIPGTPIVPFASNVEGRQGTATP